MSYTAPVEKLHSSEVNHAMSAATSSARPTRPMGISDVMCASTSGDVVAFMGVSITAGAIALTSTPVLASSLPRDLVNAMTAALLAEYALRFGLPSLPAILAI